MGFPEYPFENRGRSFVPREEVLEFLKSYAREFHLNDVIKFTHNVINVTPLDGNRWEVNEFELFVCEKKK